MARVIDHVLALLPFEPPYMQAAGMSCDFVGHPVVAEQQAGPAEVAAIWKRRPQPTTCRTRPRSRRRGAAR